jgi:hypothetical protein
VKKKLIQRHKKSASSAKPDAWAAAAAYGCDTELLEASLRRTPQERIDFHQAILNRIQQLRADAKQVFDRAAKLGQL